MSSLPCQALYLLSYLLPLSKYDDDDIDDFDNNDDDNSDDNDYDDFVLYFYPIWCPAFYLLPLSKYEHGEDTDDDDDDDTDDNDDNDCSDCNDCEDHVLCRTLDLQQRVGRRQRKNRATVE